MKTILERIKAKIKINPETGCWEWQGAKNKNGYGIFTSLIDGQKNNSAHRSMWAVHNGAIPDGKGVLHKCDNPSCVNIEHLWIGTQADNLADMFRKGRHRAAHGTKHPVSKLNDEAVSEIRKRIIFRSAPGKRDGNMASLAREFGVDLKTVHSLVHRKTWKHVP